MVSHMDTLSLRSGSAKGRTSHLDPRRQLHSRWMSFASHLPISDWPFSFWLSNFGGLSPTPTLVIVSILVVSHFMEHC